MHKVFAFDPLNGASLPDEPEAPAHGRRPRCPESLLLNFQRPKLSHLHSLPHLLPFYPLEARGGGQGQRKARKTHVLTVCAVQTLLPGGSVDLAVFTLLAQHSVRWTVEYEAPKPL